MILLSIPVLANPLAIPVDPQASVVVPAPAPASPMSLQAYRDHALAVRSYTTWGPSTSSGVSFGVGFGFPGVSVGTRVGGFNPGPVPLGDDWAVFRGAERLSVPAWMELSSDVEGRDRLKRRVRATRTGHHVLLGATIAGAAAAIAGSIGKQNAASYPGFDDWNLVVTGGIVVAIGAGAGVYGTSRHLRRLQLDYDATQDLQTTWDEVQRHNQRLRDELALSPEDTAAIDAAASR